MPDSAQFTLSAGCWDWKPRREPLTHDERLQCGNTLGARSGEADSSSVRRLQVDSAFAPAAHCVEVAAFQGGSSPFPLCVRTTTGRPNRYCASELLCGRRSGSAFLPARPRI